MEVDSLFSIFDETSEQTTSVSEDSSVRGTKRPLISTESKLHGAEDEEDQEEDYEPQNEMDGDDEIPDDERPQQRRTKKRVKIDDVR